MAESQYWTEAPKKQAHELLWDYAGHLEKQHQPRLALDKACLRLVAPKPNLAAVQRSPNGSIAAVSAYDSFRNQGPNLSKEVVGGALAMLVRPLQVKIMPVGADWQLRAFCQQASKLVDGVMAAEKWSEVFQRVAEDAMHTTLGAVKVYVDSKDQIRLERVDTLGLFWDMHEGENPLTLVQVHAVPRRRLMAMYPAAKDKLKDMPAWSPPAIPGVDHYSTMGKPDTIKVIEATAVKIGDEVGRHSIIAQGLTLEDDAFADEEHDICVFRWENEPRGFGGISLVRGVAPYHALLSRYQRMRTEQLKACVPIIWVPDDEETFKNISDLEYQIGRYSGMKPPEIAIAGKTSDDLVTEMDIIRQRAYHENGVSYEFTTSTAPEGVESGAAKRERVDVQNLRQIQRQYRIEGLFKAVADKICRKAATTYQDKAAIIRAPGSDFLEEVQWPKDLAEEKYQAVASVASGLSLTVSGKIDQLERLANLKVIEPDDVGAQLRLPDTEQEQELRSAPGDLARKQISDILNGKAAKPGPDQDHAKAYRLAKLELQLAQKKGVYPPAVIQALRRYLRACETFLAPPVAPVNPLPAPPPGAAPAMLPAPPPMATLPPVV